MEDNKVTELKDPSIKDKLPELSESAARINIPEGTEVHTSPGRFDTPLQRVSKDAVFVYNKDVMRPAKNGVWFYGEIESPPEVKTRYNGKVWVRLDVKRGKQGGNWRGASNS